MSVIDFHSHILPGIDDGARNLETSLAMLRQVSSQRVDYMIATPHFYASHYKEKMWRGTPAEDRPAGRSSFIWN